MWAFAFVPFPAMSPALIHGIISLFLCLIFLCHFLPFFTDGPGTYLEFVRKNSFITFLSPTSLGPRLAALLSSLQALWSLASWENLSLRQLSHINFSVSGVLSLDLSVIPSSIRAAVILACRRESTTFLTSILSLCNTVFAIVYPPVRQYTKKDASWQLVDSFCTLSSIINTTTLLLSFSVHSLFVLDRWFKSGDIVQATVIAAGADQESYWTNWRRSAAVAVVGFLSFVPVWVLLWWAVEYVSEAVRFFQLAAQDETLGVQGRKTDLRRAQELENAARNELEKLEELAKRVERPMNFAEQKELKEMTGRVRELVNAAEKELEKVNEMEGLSKKGQ